MKLQSICEGSSLTLFKGISEFGGLKDWPTTQIGERGTYIPGFLSNWYIGRVYSEPELTGDTDSPCMIAEFSIDPSMIEDRTEEFKRWCDENNNLRYDISISFPQEWREDDSIWTVSKSGSGHEDGVGCFENASFVYAGVSLPYKVAAFYNNQEEWLTHEII